MIVAGGGALTGEMLGRRNNEVLLEAADPLPRMERYMLRIFSEATHIHRDFLMRDRQLDYGRIGIVNTQSGQLLTHDAVRYVCRYRVERRFQAHVAGLIGASGDGVDRLWNASLLVACDQQRDGILAGQCPQLKLVGVHYCPFWRKADTRTRRDADTTHSDFLDKPAGVS